MSKVNVAVSRFAALVVISVAMLAPAAAQDAALHASKAGTDPLYSPLIDSVEEDYLEATADLPTYEFDGRFTPASESADARIEGRVEITWRNLTGSPVDEVYVRLYPNAPEYEDGVMRIIRSSIDGERAPGNFSEDDTLYTIPLESAIKEDAVATILLNFETVIPTDPVESYGMFKFDSQLLTYSMAHWQPLLAGWDDRYGWNTGPISQNGDPVYTESAVFDVELGVPNDIVFVASGSLIDQKRDDVSTLLHFASGPSRDFVMAASPSFEVLEAEVGETTVRSYSLPGSGDGSQRVLDAAAESLALYNDLIGPYPYEEFDLVQVDIGNGAGGVEFPGIVYIGSDFYDRSTSDDGPGMLEFVVVHEVAHQWFYAVVGNNQYQHAFLDESLCNYLSIFYYAVEYSAEEAHNQANLHLRLSYFNKLFREGDQLVDQPTDDFATMRDYGVIVYGKGALAFMELRREIGTDAFFDGLARYYDEFAFEVAHPEDLKAAFEEASGQDLDDFWSHWFEQAAGEEDFDATDLARLLRELND
jgi:hypothetical protein